MAEEQQWVIRITGSKPRLGGDPFPWQAAAYLAWYDPDAKGASQIGWLPDAAKAKVYPSALAAKQDYERIAQYHERREDGRENRPLFDRNTIEIMPLLLAIAEGNGGG